MINKNEINKMLSDYDSWFEEYGDSYLSVGWNKPKANDRFQIFLDEFNSFLINNELVVLDLGCGLAHFYQYLKERKINVTYIGVDINPKFIDFCQKKYPDQQFICDSIENLKLSCDIIIASGLFNRRFKESLKFIESTFKFAEKSARVAFAFNFLHDKALKKYPLNYYSSVSALENLYSRKYLSGFKIDASTIKGEFTFFGYK